MGQLPNTLWELIELAIKDLKQAEVNPGCRIDMYEWHFFDNGVCNVCLAGAVMKGTLRVPDQKNCSPINFPNDKRKLWALEDVRCGEFIDALRTFYKCPRDYPDELTDIDFERYENNRDKFYSGLEEAVKILKGVNL